MMRGNTGLAAIFAAGCLVLSAVPVWGEVTVDWDDLTDAQQRQAYEQLESENHMLREQLAALQGSGGSGDARSGNFRNRAGRQLLHGGNRCSRRHRRLPEHSDKKHRDISVGSDGFL